MIACLFADPGMHYIITLHTRMLSNIFTLTYILTKSHKKWILTAGLLLHIALAYICLQYRGDCCDEEKYFNYAYRWAKGHPERVTVFDDSKTAIMAPALAPKFIDDLTHSLPRDFYYTARLVHRGHYFVIIFSLGMLVYLWLLLQRFKPSGWWLVWALAVFDPLLLTYATMITSDMATGAFAAMFLYHFLRYRGSGNRIHFVAFTFAAAMGFAAKFSFLPVLLSLGLAFAIEKWTQRNAWFFLQKRFIACLLVFSAGFLLFLNGLYYFRGSFHSLSQMQFRSTRFQQLQKQPVISAIPLPVPQNMVEAADLLTMQAKETPAGDSALFFGVHIFNTHRDDGGFWYYYIASAAMKMPLPLLLLVITGGGAVCVSSIKKKKNIYWYPLALSAGFMLYSGFFNPFQSGIRHMLAIYPCILLLAGAGIAYIYKHIKYNSAVLLVLGGWYAASWLYYFPHLLPYTNELVQPKKAVFNFTCDTNVDYCQNREHLLVFLKEHPDYTVFEGQLKPGKYVIEIRTLLYHVDFAKDARFQWLAKQTPAGHERFSLLLYEIDAADLRTAPVN